jgi:hypothetical protein
MMIHPFAWQMFKFAPNLSGLRGKQNSFFVSMQSSAGAVWQVFVRSFQTVE